MAAGIIRPTFNVHFTIKWVRRVKFIFILKAKHKFLVPLSIYELWPTYSFLLLFQAAPLTKVALTTSRIDLMIYLIDSTNIVYICD